MTASCGAIPTPPTGELRVSVGPPVRERVMWQGRERRVANLATLLGRLSASEVKRVREAAELVERALTQVASTAAGLSGRAHPSDIRGSSRSCALRSRPARSACRTRNRARRACCGRDTCVCRLHRAREAPVLVRALNRIASASCCDLLRCGRRVSKFIRREPRGDAGSRSPRLARFPRSRVVSEIECNRLDRSARSASRPAPIPSRLGPEVGEFLPRFLRSEQPHTRALLRPGLRQYELAHRLRRTSLERRLLWADLARP